LGTQAFVQSTPRAAADPHLVRLAFAEFVECLARCALMSAMLADVPENYRKVRRPRP
jgi:hypothetical protein